MQKQEATGFGVTADGKEARLYTLENKNGMKACVSDYGAVLVDLFVPDKEGKMRRRCHWSRSGQERQPHRRRRI